jgi:hypothetical protein
MNAKSSNPPQVPRRKKPRKPAKYTLKEAFYYEQAESRKTLDLQKALRSAAFLLEWASSFGNDDLSGMLALGLAGVLNKCAERVSRLFAIDAVIKLGANPQEAFKCRDEED